MPGMSIWPDNRRSAKKQALFDEVAMTHFHGLYYAALRLTGSPMDAEDLLQETYTKAYTSFEQFSLGTNARAWLYRIMTNTFINSVRRSEARLSRTFSEISSVVLSRAIDSTTMPDPASTVLNRTLDERLSISLGTLSRELRTVLIVVDVGGFSYQEAATILGCPIGTVRSRLHRAHTVMRLRLTEGATESFAEVNERFTEGVTKTSAERDEGHTETSGTTLKALEGEHGQHR